MAMVSWHPALKEVDTMPRKSPFQIVLSDQEERELSSRARKYTLAYFQVQRAKMILMAAQERENDEIARRLDTCREVVCFWRKRFLEKRLDGLEERPRPGRPRVFPPGGGRSDQGADGTLGASLPLQLPLTARVMQCATDVDLGHAQPANPLGSRLQGPNN